jgi:hypothetical protein
MSLEFPNLNRHTQAAKKKRAMLIEKLGSKCDLCPETDEAKLEFDHINGRNYNPNTLSYRARMNRYEREAELGLIRLLCGDCNKKERKTNDNGQHIRTEHASLVPLTAAMPF